MRYQLDPANALNFDQHCLDLEDIHVLNIHLN